MHFPHLNMAKRPLEDADGVKAKKPKIKDQSSLKNEGSEAVKISKKERRKEKKAETLEQDVPNGDANEAEKVQSHGETQLANETDASSAMKRPKKERKKKKDKKTSNTEEEPTVGGLKKQNVADILRKSMREDAIDPSIIFEETEREEKFEIVGDRVVKLPEDSREGKAKKKTKRSAITEDGDVELPRKSKTTSKQVGEQEISEPVNGHANGTVNEPMANHREPAINADMDVSKAEKAARKAEKAARKTEKAEKKRLKAAKQEAGESIAMPSEVMSANGDGTKSETQKAIPSGPPTATTQYTEDSSLTSLPQATITDYLTENSITISDPTTSSPLRPIISFSQLTSAYTASPSPFASFKSPTPIQSASWPFLFSGRDVIGVAETGSGKTLAFGVPCIRSIQSSLASNSGSKGKRNVNHNSSARAIMVSPTRELAIQIHEQLSALATPAGLSTACLYGGVPKDSQRLALATAHIIVATPGRLNDLIDEGHADLSLVQYLVLDEADRMLDKGFEDQIRNIIKHTPSSSSGRQTLMFTATWPPSVRDLASTFMTNPVHISIGADNPTGELRANVRITQKVEVVDPEAKQARMLQIIKAHQKGNERILAFCLYKKEAVRVEGFLRSKGLKVAAIHGDMSQDKRLASLEAFKSGACPLLVATDVAARGLDIPSVKLVLNITFPLTAEDYVHRIGRTGRAGKEGLAITLFTVHDKGQSGALVNVLRAAGQEIPKELLDFGGTVKKKEHGLYGAFAKDVGEGAPSKGTKIRFD